MQGQQQKQSKPSPAASTTARPTASRARGVMSRLSRAVNAFAKDSWQAVCQICGAVKIFFSNLNLYSTTSVLLTLCAMVLIWIGHPAPSKWPDLCRAIALILGVSASLMASTNLSKVPRTPPRIMEDRKVSLVLSIFAAFFVALPLIFDLLK